MWHAEELGEELATKCAQNLLKQVDHFLSAINGVSAESNRMFLGGNEPRFYKRNVRGEFFGEFEVNKKGRIFQEPVFFGLQFLFDAVLLLVDQLKV